MRIRVRSSLSTAFISRRQEPSRSSGSWLRARARVRVRARVRFRVRVRVRTQERLLVRATSFFLLPVKLGSACYFLLSTSYLVLGTSSSTVKTLRKFYFLLPTSYSVLTVKKLEKCLSAGRSALSCNTKWKPVVSMPVNALDEPPCFCRKALNAPSSGKLSVPRNLPGGGVRRWRYGGSSRTRTQGGTAFGQLALPEAACSVGRCLRLPPGCPQASANQPPGLRWPSRARPHFRHRDGTSCAQ